MTKFKLDAHVHTMEASPCSHLHAAEVVREYHKHGYGGIVITDHLGEYFLSSLKSRKNWHSCMDIFLKGYQNAKVEGDKLGLEVILGAEIRFNSHSGDFLLYGIDENFLYDNPHMHKLTPREFFSRFKDEFLIIQAHPYRNGNKNVPLGCIHGVEVINGNPWWPDNGNEKAQALCKANPHFYPFYGSDTHQAQDVGRVYMQFGSKIENADQLRKAVIDRNYTGGMCE